MKRKWLLLSPLVAVSILPLFAPAQRPVAVPATAPATTEVFFSPKGGCTEAIVRELGTAKTSIQMQAYSFTSTEIAKALIDAKKRGVKVDSENLSIRSLAHLFLTHCGLTPNSSAH